MRPGNQRPSANVEDRRGIGLVCGGLGIGGIAIALIVYFLGFDPGAMLNVAEQVAPQRETREAPTEGASKRGVSARPVILPKPM